MNSQSLGLLRDILKLLGTTLASRGVIADSEVELAVGGAIALIGVIWSAICRYQRSKTAPAPASANPPPPAAVLCLLLLPCLLAGCVQTKVEAGGARMTTTRFLWPGSIGKASVTASNAAMNVEGYTSESTQLIEAVAAGVAAGLKR